MDPLGAIYIMTGERYENLDDVPEVVLLRCLCALLIVALGADVFFCRDIGALEMEDA